MVSHHQKTVLLLVLLAGTMPPAYGQDFGRVPGTVISYIESPVVVFGADLFPVYLCDPSIVVLPNGDYVASHARFDWGSTAKDYGLTSVFRSSDKGVTWTKLCTLKGILRASLFVHDGALYLMGTEAEGKTNVIRKSTDNGDTWTEPRDAQTGRLGAGGLGTPNNVVTHNGRIWSGAGRGFFSAPVDADLLHADSWTRSKPVRPSVQGHPWGDRWQDRWGEGQVAASPHTGVYVLPKIRGLQNTALIKAISPRKIHFDASAPDAFPCLPGADKKFGVGYDDVSATFYVLSNPVLPAHAGATKPEMIRTAAAVVTSRDLIHWDVRKIFLFTENVDNGTWGEGFQYFNFDIDGEDLVVASRTAFDVGDGHRKPPRGHDSNLLTFHRIEGFRHLTPEHILVLDTENDQIRRYEITQHQNAPLGQFPLGNTFAGAPLRRPVAMGVSQQNGGSIYIREFKGRVLRFDLAGNFQEVSEQASVAMQSAPLSIGQPPKGYRTWTKPGAGDWYDLENWYYWGRPDSNCETAYFGSAIATDATIAVSHPYTAKGLIFRSLSSYTISGAGRICLGSDSEQPCSISVQQGIHRIAVPLELLAPTSCEVAEGTELHFDKDLNLNGQHITMSGRGAIYLHGALSLRGSTLVLNHQTRLVFAPPAPIGLDGRLVFVSPEPATLKAGQAFTLWQGAQHLTGRFDEISLPLLPSVFAWDLSRLYVDGTIRVITAKAIVPPKL